MRPPLNGRLVLTGSFAEYRGNHYHSGIDYRTKNLPDRNVYAVDKGYIRRIKISPAGYGRAIYIAHSNGLTSVYGHLDFLSARIDSMVRNIQYANHSFGIDTTFSPGIFPVSKGEILGVAGNSGFSFGEHLHFELRNTDTDDPINPYPLYLEVYDTISPAFRWLKISGDMSKDGIFTRDTILDLRKAGTRTILVSDTFALAFGIDDFSALYGGKLIPYSISVSIDNKPEWEAVFDRYSFDETRMCRASFDFAVDKKFKREMINTYSIYSKSLPFIRHSKNNGSFRLNDDSVHLLSVNAVDYSGNKSILTLKIKRRRNFASGNNFATFFKADSTYSFKNNDFEILIQAGTLTDHLYLKQPFVQFSQERHAFQIGNEYFGLLRPVYVYIDYANEKSLLAKIKNGQIEETFAPVADNLGRKKVEISECGEYQLVQDTVSPQILKTNLQGGNISKSQKVEIIVTDNSKKISSFKAMANGEWVLMEYDLKSNLFTISRKDLPKTPQIQLILEFSDRSGNFLKKEFLLKQ